MGPKDVEKGDEDSVSIKEATLEDVSPKQMQREDRKLVFDTGEEQVRYRRNWWQLWSVESTFVRALPQYEIPIGYPKIPRHPHQSRWMMHR